MHGEKEREKGCGGLRGSPSSRVSIRRGRGRLETTAMARRITAGRVEEDGPRRRFRAFRHDSFVVEVDEDEAELVVASVCLGEVCSDGDASVTTSSSSARWAWEEQRKRRGWGAGECGRGAGEARVLVFFSAGEGSARGPRRWLDAAWPRRQRSSWLQEEEGHFAKNSLQLCFQHSQVLS